MVKRAKAEKEFRAKPFFEVQGVDDSGQNCISTEPADFRLWRDAREGQDSLWTVVWREMWLQDRGLASRSEAQTPSLETLVQIHLDKSVGKEPTIPLTADVLKNICYAIE